MPRLVIKHGNGVGRDHALGAGPCIVGRDPAVEFTLDDHLVSRQHFQVVPEGGAWFVQDLGSTNGTIVNGRKVERVRLADGDLIQVGGTRLSFVQKDILQKSGPPAPVRVRRKLQGGAAQASGAKPAAPVPERRKDKAQPPHDPGQKPAAPPVRRRKHLR